MRELVEQLVEAVLAEGEDREWKVVLSNDEDGTDGLEVRVSVTIKEIVKTPPLTNLLLHDRNYLM